MINAHQVAYNPLLVEKLATTRILVCGAGALGSNLLDNLARHGAKQLTTIDFDKVEEHNIGTQLYTLDDIGISKVTALRTKLYAATGVELNTFAQKLSETNLTKVFRRIDFVFETFDNLPSRQLVADYCRTQKIPCLHLGLDAATGEVCWNEKYQLPQNWQPPAAGACDLPLARNIVLWTALVGLQTCFQAWEKQQQKNYFLDLSTLSISEF